MTTTQTIFNLKNINIDNFLFINKFESLIEKNQKKIDMHIKDLQREYKKYMKKRYKTKLNNPNY